MPFFGISGSELVAMVVGVGAAPRARPVRAGPRPRTGHFDRQVQVDHPDNAGQVQILKVHIQKIRLYPQVELEQMAQLPTGFSGADLANLCNEAALGATGRNAQEMVALMDSSWRWSASWPVWRRKTACSTPANARWGPATRWAMCLQGTDTVHKVSIMPRGIGALGYAIQQPTEDRFLMTAQDWTCPACCPVAGSPARTRSSTLTRPCGRS